MVPPSKNSPLRLYLPLARVGVFMLVHQRSSPLSSESSSTHSRALHLDRPSVVLVNAPSFPYSGLIDLFLRTEGLFQIDVEAVCQV
jgi:hypothetical protein